MGGAMYMFQTTQSLHRSVQRSRDGSSGGTRRGGSSPSTAVDPMEPLRAPPWFFAMAALRRRWWRLMNFYPPWTFILRFITARKDKTQDGAWRWSMTQSVELETLSGWLKPFNCAAIDADPSRRGDQVHDGYGFCSIGISQTWCLCSTVRLEDIKNNGFDSWLDWWDFDHDQSDCCRFSSRNNGRECYGELGALWR